MLSAIRLSNRFLIVAAGVASLHRYLDHHHLGSSYSMAVTDLSTTQSMPAINKHLIRIIAAGKAATSFTGTKAVKT